MFISADLLTGVFVSCILAYILLGFIVENVPLNRMVYLMNYRL